MINIARIDSMIAEIQSKDVQAIVDKETYIPTLGNANTVSQVQNWLNKRIGYLEQAKTMTQAKLDIFVTNYYNGLSDEEKLVADRILAGENCLEITEEIWEEVVLFIIYKWITEE